MDQIILRSHQTPKCERYASSAFTLLRLLCDQAVFSHMLDMMGNSLHQMHPHYSKDSVCFKQGSELATSNMRT